MEGEDNDSYMIGDNGISRCKTCGYKTDYEYLNPDFKLTIKKFDISYTYDGACIVSERFKHYCADEKLDGLEFIAIKNAPEHYLLIANNIIAFDPEKANTVFENYCESCHSYESVISGNIALKNITQPIIDGIYRTDLVFASEDEKSPILIVGTRTFEKMNAQEFKGIDFEPIRY